ncbi:MAG: hypothetical protein NUV53_00820 [Patescibacteria group bacterium]|nr:hypothetical protein [Patescibacteria group bacterium]
MELESFASKGNVSHSPVPPVIPTPPAEVFIRTMESDLQSLHESGGLSVGQVKLKPERVFVSPDAEAKNYAKRHAAPTTHTVEKRWLALAGVSAVAFVGILAYIFVNFSLPSFQGFFPGDILSEQNNTETGNEVVAVVTSSVPVSEPEVLGSPTRLNNFSMWRKPADHTISFIAAGAIADAASLKTPVQRLLEVLPSRNSTSTLLEIVPQNTVGTTVPLPEFLPLLDMDVLDSAFFSKYFENQFVMFAYRDKEGIWPGLVLALRPGENWLFLKNDAAPLEDSPKIANFYLSDPGTPKGKFHDISIGSIPARALEWNPPVGQAGVGARKFVYGWFRGYLLMSASQEGLEQMVQRL